MWIKDIAVIPADIAYRVPFVISGGSSAVGNHVLVAVTTDEGIVGYGEAAPMVSYSDETQSNIVHGLRDLLIPAVTGMHPFDLEALHHKMDAVLPGHSFAKAAIDLACYDIMGKALNLPVYRLLGGQVRESVPIAWVVGMGSLAAMVAEAAEHAVRGYGTIKLKIGRDPAHDLELVRQVRAAVGSGVKIRVDANQGYDVATAIRVLHKMEAYDLELVEQPVKKWDLLGMAKVAAALDMPVEADESMFNFHDAHTLIHLGAADIINIKIMKPGGLYPSKKVAAVCEAAGITCLVGSMVEFGVGTAAGLHFAASTPAVQHACEMVGPLLYADDVTEEDFGHRAIQGGALRVPQAPGLGVTLRPAYREACSV